jgi:hypothetical protein
MSITKPRRCARSALGACAAALILASSSGAMAEWKRNGAITGPNGNTAVTQGGGQCDAATRSCAYGGSITGPRGKSFKRSGGVSATGAGGLDSSATYQGPRGRTATRNGSLRLQ